MALLSNSLLIVVTACLCGLLAAESKAQEPTGTRPNLLTNGSFEKGTDGWIVNPYHRQGTAALDPTEMRDGQATLRVTNNADDTMVTQKVTVKPMMRYRITGYIKSKDIIPQKPQNKTGASLAIKGASERSEMVLKTKAWTKISWEFESGNRTEIEIGPRLGFYSSEVTGTAWFSDLVLVELGKARK